MVVKSCLELFALTFKHKMCLLKYLPNLCIVVGIPVPLPSQRFDLVLNRACQKMASTPLLLGGCFARRPQDMAKLVVALSYGLQASV